MRTWIYSYASSDGLRHEGEMTAEAKDIVYSVLRSKGIKPIKVTERITPIVVKGFRGLRRTDWCLVITILVAVIVLTSGVTAYHLRRSRMATPSDLMETFTGIGDRSDVFVALSEAVDSLNVAYQASLSDIDVELLTNYASLELTKDITPFSREFARWRDLISTMRTNVKDVFASYYAEVESACSDDALEVKRLYGMVMASIDADEELLSEHYYVFAFLVENRQCWRIHKGKIVWNDAQKESEFRQIRGDILVGSKRWRIDLSPSQFDQSTEAPL